MKVGGQILWNVIPICETSQIYYLMGRRPMKDVLGKRPIIPFGSLVEYHPITAKDQSRIHQFGKKVLPGLFLGYALYAGGIWKGDVLIADLEELETMDASEIYSKRLNAKEVIFPKQGEFIFPIADGRIKTPGGDQEPRTSTLVRQCLPPNNIATAPLHFGPKVTLDLHSTSCADWACCDTHPEGLAKTR